MCWQHWFHMWYLLYFVTINFWWPIEIYGRKKFITKSIISKHIHKYIHSCWFTISISEHKIKYQWYFNIYQTNITYHILYVKWYSRSTVHFGNMSINRDSKTFIYSLFNFWTFSCLSVFLRSMFFLDSIEMLFHRTKSIGNNDNIRK